MQTRCLSTISRRLRGFDAPTVWSEFTPLANQFNSVNLGQGFPDWNTPDYVKDALKVLLLLYHNYIHIYI